MGKGAPILTPKSHKRLKTGREEDFLPREWTEIDDDVLVCFDHKIVRKSEVNWLKPTNTPSLKPYTSFIPSKVTEKKGMKSKVSSVHALLKKTNYNFKGRKSNTTKKKLKNKNSKYKDILKKVVSNSFNIVGKLCSFSGKVVWKGTKVAATGAILFTVADIIDPTLFSVPEKQICHAVTTLIQTANVVFEGNKGSWMDLAFKNYSDYYSCVIEANKILIPLEYTRNWLYLSSKLVGGVVGSFLASKTIYKNL